MKKYLLILFMVVYGTNIMAQDDEVLAKYKAMFTINFIRYIGWSDEAKKGDFVIGVVRDKLIADQLRSLSAGKNFGYQPIVIKEFNKPEDITDCQILYFSNYANFSKNAVDLVIKLKGKNSLIITEVEGATENGSMINFVVRDDKLKFEVSPSNAAKFGLIFSSSLTTLSNAIVK